jgi:hypothetical protein
MIEKGKYKGRAVGEVVLGVSKEKGTPFIECFFEVTEGKFEGERVRWTGYFTETADRKGKTVAERTIESLQTCGWSGEDVGEFADHELHGLDTNDVQLVVDIETYERDGETKSAPRVQWINRLGSVNLENAMGAAEAQAFGSKMKGLVLSMKQKRPQPPADPAIAGAQFPFGENAPSARAAGQRRAF